MGAILDSETQNFLAAQRQQDFLSKARVLPNHQSPSIAQSTTLILPTSAYTPSLELWQPSKYIHRHTTSGDVPPHFRTPILRLSALPLSAFLRTVREGGGSEAVAEGLSGRDEEGVVCGYGEGVWVVL